MLVKEKNIHKILGIFLFAHVIIWTLVPSISNINLPLDTIEALAWGSNLDWGYNKHPPFSAWTVEFFFQIFGNNDWAYYLLSQLFVVFTFFIVFKFSLDFFDKKIFSLISILLLEGIYFYNFTTPEFNVNVCQLPFFALAVFYCWESLKKNNISKWLLFGLFAALGVLSKYLFFYLLISLDIFFIYYIYKKKINYKCFVSLISFFAILIPHFIWLFENDFITILYALKRTGLENSNFFSAHLIHPLTFLFKQIGILIPFFIMCFFIISNFKTKIKLKDKKLVFLISVTVIPLLLIILTSLILGIKIRTMWMTPFYLFLGVLFIYIFEKKIMLKKLKYFFSIFLILFVFSPITYFYISTTQDSKRTDYPGKDISNIVQETWNKNFSNKIELVSGDEWHGGNLSYHLDSRPIWDSILEANRNISFKDIDGGFVMIGDADTLVKICSGVFLKTNDQGICMIGKKK